MPRIKRLLTVLFTGLLIAYLAICAAVFFGQQHLLFHPMPSSPRAPSFLPPPQEISLLTEDGERLRAWYWPGTRGTCVVHFHGNSGDRGGPVRWLRGYVAQGYGLFVLDYRGYGGSTGEVSTVGFEADVRATLAWLTAHQINDRIYSGRSLGTGLAIYAATLSPPRALVLHAAYSAMADVAAARFPWLPARLLLRHRFPSSDRIAQLDVPLWMVHGAQDRVIPARLGRRLFDASPAKLKHWRLLLDAGHNDVVAQTPNYQAEIAAFLAQTEAL